MTTKEEELDKGAVQLSQYPLVSGYVQPSAPEQPPPYQYAAALSQEVSQSYMSGQNVPVTSYAQLPAPGQPQAYQYASGQPPDQKQLVSGYGQGQPQTVGQPPTYQYGQQPDQNTLVSTYVQRPSQEKAQLHMDGQNVSVSGYAQPQAPGEAQSYQCIAGQQPDQTQPVSGYVQSLAQDVPQSYQYTAGQQPEQNQPVSSYAQPQAPGEAQPYQCIAGQQPDRNQPVSGYGQPLMPGPSQTYEVPQHCAQQQHGQQPYEQQQPLMPTEIQTVVASQPAQEAPPPVKRTDPPSYTLLAYLTLLCCFPFALVAIVKSRKVKSAVRGDRANDAEQASRSARNYSIFAIIFGAIIYGYCLLRWVVPYFLAMARSK